MKINLSSVVFFSFFSTLIRVNSARKLRTAELNHILRKHAADVKASTRQDISYNLDLINRNGSSALMYSQPNDVINGGFTDWSIWSPCNSGCGKRSLRSRERYCTNPSPSNGGADCDGERFQLTLCKMIPCSSVVTAKPKPRHVIGKFAPWSSWSKCQCNIAYQRRTRRCYSHSKASRCPGRRVQTRACKPRGCKTPVTEKSSLVDIDPKQFCGFNPCDISKCLLAPLGSCVSDYKCRPVFFDENNKRIEGCAGKHIYISPAQVPEVCKINPCEFTRCLMDFTEERCVVGTKCQAVYYSAEGQPQKCTAVLKVPARQVCGYDPCNGESCQDNPNARCLVTSKCRPVFVNTFNERIRKCEEETAAKNDRIAETREDEFEAEPDDDGDDDGNEDDQEDESIDHNNDDIGFDNDDDIGSDDDDDDVYDDNRYSYRKHFHDEERENERFIDSDDDGNDDDDDRETSEENNTDMNAFKNKLATAEDLPQYHSKKPESEIEPNANMVQNSGNFSNPLLKLLNVENGERRSKNPKKKISNINPSAFNLQDLVSGKLNNSTGLVVGTVEKSMKILSNKKPTTYYYFETKGENPKENRQFMVITATKTKKSSVQSKRKKNDDKRV